MREGKVKAAYTPTIGGIAEAVMKMAFGNGFGFKFNDELSKEAIFDYSYGSFILECEEEIEGILVGEVTNDGLISYRDEALNLNELLGIYEDKLESVFKCNIENTGKDVVNFEFNATEYSAPAIKVARPKVRIPVFPGTNCE